MSATRMSVQFIDEWHAAAHGVESFARYSIDNATVSTPNDVAE
ncbi:MAG TPA: hypothetical protein VGM82_13605 [Gemmatimonadaceae bacterium]|jgi:hypothetical protein